MPDTKTKPAKYDMLTNVPVTVDIKYVDVWPDKNGYGSQVSVKGAIDGELQTIYLKGKSWANLKALAEAGVIAGYSKEDEEPAEKVNLPVVNGTGVTLCRRQGPGERFANLTVETNGASKPKTNGTAKQGVELGGPIAGLDDVDELPPVEEAYDLPPTQPTGAMAEKLNAMMNLYDLCYTHAFSIAKRHSSLSYDGSAVAAMAATLFIQANNRGLHL